MLTKILFCLGLGLLCALPCPEPVAVRTAPHPSVAACDFVEPIGTRFYVDEVPYEMTTYPEEGDTYTTLWARHCRRITEFIAFNGLEACSELETEDWGVDTVRELGEGVRVFVARYAWELASALPED